MRGINTREVKLADFFLPRQGRGSLATYLQGALQSSLKHPGTIYVHPERTKTHAQNPYMISIDPAHNPVLDTGHWIVAVYCSTPWQL